MGDDRSDYLDREKKSFSELDRARRERGDGDERPRGPAGDQLAQQASKAYLEQIDGLFSSGGAAKREALATALLDARGTPALNDACRAYREAVGLPTLARQIACFLDADAPDVLLAGIEAARASRAGGTLEVSAGLRTQLRMLSDHPNDDVAEEAELLLDEL